MLWLHIGLPRLAREVQASGRAAARAALERLAAWAYQWSSLVHYREAGSTGTGAALWLEINASATLFGGHALLLEQITAGLATLDYSYTLGLAPSIEGAALLARVAARTDCAQVDATQAGGANIALELRALRQRMAPLSLQWLALPNRTISALRSAGLSRIGELLALPPAGIARRFGPQTSLYLRQLCGTAPDPRTAWQLPATYGTRCEFATPLGDATALRFPLQRLLWEFQGYLRAIDRGVQRFTLRLEHPPRSASATVLAIGLSRPSRDAAQFAALIKERLAATTLMAPVCALGLEALEFTTPSVMQSDFFGTETQQLQQLQYVLDRLRARLGAECVHNLRTHADHRPEHAWRKVASDTENDNANSGTAIDAARPCWLLPQPQRIDEPLQILSGPERIESGWWDGRDCARDYYLARTATGARWWVFRNLRAGDWYLQGLWA